MFLIGFQVSLWERQWYIFVCIWQEEESYKHEKVENEIWEQRHMSMGILTETGLKKCKRRWHKNSKLNADFLFYLLRNFPALFLISFALFRLTVVKSEWGHQDLISLSPRQQQVKTSQFTLLVSNFKCCMSRVNILLQYEIKCTLGGWVKKLLYLRVKLWFYSSFNYWDN